MTAPTDIPSAATDLAFLLGRLAGPETIHASDWTEAASASASAEAHARLDGCIVVQDHRTTPESGRAFETMNVFMLDPTDGSVLLYGFDSAGYPPAEPSRGRWQDGSLVFDRQTPRGISQTVYTPVAGGYRWSKQFRPLDAATWQLVVDGELTGRQA